MKKLITLLLMLFITTGIAFAQSNEVTLDQDGDNNISTITQVLSWNSDADVKQEGNNNTSTVEQAGLKQSVSLYNVGDENTVSQTQYGAKNSQRIELWGDDNQYRADQIGYSNFIYLNARGTGPGLWGRPSNGGNNTSNVADIEQAGANNLFTGSVTGSYNMISTEQDGHGNQIGGSYSTAMPSAAPHGAPIGTWGFLSNVYNGGAWSGNGVNIYGDGNDVDLEQSGNANINFAFIEGDDNKIVQRMTDGSENIGIQVQEGTNNKSIMELWGDDNLMLTAQNGSGNELFLNARGTGSGFTNGGGNSSNIFVGLQAKNDNLISAGIDGSYNEVGLVQYGSDNTIGSGLYAVDGARVEGDYNTLKIGQFSDNNSAFASITGNGNESTIIQ